ncbi:MAG: tRNA (guanine-N(1)-)-methyltransferase [candidate division WWE3 bacterium GW2011_GWA2_46_9]|uniref:tRNA (Guanine-N(1)-)-methyltransferase n=1 Tax=candidate division WWE3 bacterium GW2011_GWA2_46_9 TaxID=1619111 RepID=A0A0G1TUP7_UNCKA|nr:MAG: tRNA (guanine-N(1)-)-methyltransferase [candidate division WWE3 bacterium GW2011_GWA2_46_9]
MLRVDIITLFPDLFTLHLQTLPIKKALAKKLLEINFHQLRDFAVDKRGTVDDKPYGGGPGMILMVQPMSLCAEGTKVLTNA